MAAIASVVVTDTGEFLAAPSTLGSSDTITFDARKTQLAVFRNGTGGSLTVTIDGDGGTTVQVDGIGPVSVSSGYAITVAAGATRAVKLKSIRKYCQGVVTLTGASGMSLTVFDI
jgi:hypothetical protein